MLNDKVKAVYAVIAPLVFPEGFYIGSGKGKSNSLEIERNGKGMPVIRGTSIAGLLRSELENDPRFESYTDQYFGAPLESDFDRWESSLVFSDTTFDGLTEENMHNLMSRHTGSISEENKGLFSMERVSAAAESNLFFRLNSDDTDPELDNQILRFIGQCLNGGIFVGGNSNRGCGRCCLKENKLFIRKFEMNNPDDVAEYLDLIYSSSKSLAQYVKIEPESCSNKFQLEVTLRIPAGQDILCSLGHDPYPASTVKADNQEYWKIPGSTLRGIFKGWMSRCAAKDGEVLSDSVEQFKVRRDRKVTEMHEQEDAISDLFGSLQNRGRIHFADAYSGDKVKKSDVQARTHVVIDRFTGGTNPGKLFQNQVLISDGNVRFTTTVSIRDAQEKEIKWLLNAFQALHIGIIRIGTSKASGRVEVDKIKCTANPDNFNLDLNMKGI